MKGAGDAEWKLLTDLIESRFGLALAVRPPGGLEWGYLGLVIGAGALVGVLPAWRAYRSSLADGLSPRL